MKIYYVTRVLFVIASIVRSLQIVVIVVVVVLVVITYIHDGDQSEKFLLFRATLFSPSNFTLLENWLVYYSNVWLQTSDRHSCRAIYGDWRVLVNRQFSLSVK